MHSITSKTVAPSMINLTYQDCYLLFDVKLDQKRTIWLLKQRFTSNCNSMSFDFKANFPDCPNILQNVSRGMLKTFPFMAEEVFEDSSIDDDDEQIIFNHSDVDNPNGIKFTDDDVNDEYLHNLVHGTSVCSNGKWNEY
ncbi:unnamed protein product [Didymodactylos carnosus]|uniref:Uncharacterized protein n=1 Tax=Didymodactylos carnosus TaxID=1234261 RepID=A0A814R8V7_9BILA|nr:unnamed protein product [Didymodactylos carnosus]CAF1130525.1 unnamed protein product [Didymodactylos carnosus]CAF3861008.1 unnamed protein product [Didymodactylos carnosus]CAF3894178.1 unnamed protein product [Didymodactylos carnosus]